MPRFTLLVSAATAALVLPATVHAQLVTPSVNEAAAAASAQPGADVQATQADDEDPAAPAGSEILVIATRLKGQLDVPQAPVATLDEADIAAYGARSIPELLSALSPQTGSGRGRGAGMPVVLVNGLRISGFREMRNIPPEAIRRMEILPEEVALRFGFPPNQRVINFILKDNYTSKSAAVEYAVPTRGGTADSELEASVFKANGANRINLSASVNDTSPLTEAERGVAQSTGSVPTVAGDPDPARWRSLIGDSREIALNGTWTHGLGEKGMAGQISVNGAYTRNDSRSWSGLDLVTLAAPDGRSALRSLPDPLERRTSTDTGQAGVTFNKPVGSWQFTVTADGTLAETTVVVDRKADTSALVAAAAAGTLAIDGPLPSLAAAGFDTAKTRSTSATTLATLSGSPLRLPSGEVMATIKAGFAHTGIRSSDTRTVSGITDLRRGDLSAGINLAIPIASRREGFLGAIGEVSANVSAGLNRLSDFGTLSDWNVGLTWAPTETLNLQASYLVNEAAPSLSELGSPVVATFNVPVYDFARGETALVTVTTGGNPALQRETQRDIKLGVNWQVPFLKNSSLVAEYFRNSSDNVTASFPVLTPAIEAAFASRVTRDAAGRLVALDRRSVTFARTEGSRLRYGFNLSGSIGKPTPGGMGAGGGQRRMGMGGSGSPPSGGGAVRMAARPMGGAMGGPPPGVMMRGGPGGQGMGQGRWNLALYHTVRFSEEVTVAAGGPLLDLLNGDATSGGGVARHALELEGGAFYKGMGLRFNGNWAAPTRVRASGVPGSSDLRFGSVFKLDLRAFVDLGQKKALTDAVPFLKGARLAIKVDNLLDSRQRVTNAAGAVPVSYQADYLDPKGRVIGIDFRKMF